MAGEYRMETTQTSTGELVAVASEEWKRELMTPDLHNVIGPLAQKVWRYMRFEHFERMLREKALYVPRADTLGDPWEGSFSDTQSQPIQICLKTWIKQR